MNKFLKMACVLLIFFSAVVCAKDIYQKALPGYHFRFPQDEAAHPNFKTEWWYYTGHLKSKQGQTFGYELTFFSVGNENNPFPTSAVWHLDRLYMAHFALTDDQGKHFFHAEKTNRQGMGYAGAKTNQYWVWNENWSAKANRRTHVLHANTPNFAIDLQLFPTKPIVIHGQNGISQKSYCSGCASHYTSYTRLKTNGQIRLNHQTHNVSGESWMDHEFGSNQLTQNQVGWDWFSIQLSNQTELMLYMMRNRDGQPDSFSSGTIVLPNGQSKHLNVRQFQVRTVKTWKSKQTNALYPAGWDVHIPSENLHFTITPTVAQQELVSQNKWSPSYWEGRCLVRAKYQNKPIQGNAYVELTGYTTPFKQKL